MYPLACGGEGRSAERGAQVLILATVVRFRYIKGTWIYKSHPFCITKKSPCCPLSSVTTQGQPYRAEALIPPVSHLLITFIYPKGLGDFCCLQVGL